MVGRVNWFFPFFLQNVIVLTGDMILPLTDQKCRRQSPGFIKGTEEKILPKKVDGLGAAHKLGKTRKAEAIVTLINRCFNDDINDSSDMRVAFLGILQQKSPSMTLRVLTQSDTTGTGFSPGESSPMTMHGPARSGGRKSMGAFEEGRILIFINRLGSLEGCGVSDPHRLAETEEIGVDQFVSRFVDTAHTSKLELEFGV